MHSGVFPVHHRVPGVPSVNYQQSCCRVIIHARGRVSAPGRTCEGRSHGRSWRNPPTCRPPSAYLHLEVKPWWFSGCKGSVLTLGGQCQGPPVGRDPSMWDGRFCWFHGPGAGLLRNTRVSDPPESDTSECKRVFNPLLNSEEAADSADPARPAGWRLITSGLKITSSQQHGSFQPFLEERRAERGELLLHAGVGSKTPRSVWQHLHDCSAERNQKVSADPLSQRWKVTGRGFPIPLLEARAALCRRVQ